MRDVKLNITNDEIVVLEVYMQKIKAFNPNQTLQKVAISIGYQVLAKLEQKVRNKMRDNNNKSKVLTLKYHDAWSVEFVLRALLPHIHNPYHRVVVQKITDFLNQKLA